MRKKAELLNQYLKNKTMQTDNNLIQKVIGYSLLIPPMLGVLIFIIHLFIELFIDPPEYFVWTFWNGKFGEGTASLPSNIPIYLGLMAIAGAYLIKDNKK